MKHKERLFLIAGGLVTVFWLSANYWFFFKTNPALGGPISPIQRLVGFTKPPPSPQPVFWTLLLTGDVIPARVTNQQMVAKNDFLWPLVQIADRLKGADLTLINLEAPLLTNCPVTNEGFKFCGDARFARSLELTGVDVTNLANNHSLNYGWEGILETEKELSKVGIETTGYTTGNSPSPSLSQREGIPPLKIRGGEGALCGNSIYCSKLAIKNVQNIKIGFLGYNAVGQRLDKTLAEQEIKEVRKQVDVLVISVHWGKEYTHEPMPDMSLAPDDPKEMGKLFIDWGADVVAGNHPHWVQYLEWYKDRPIIYAQGNTVFDQEWSEETKRGVLVKLYFSNAHILREKTEVVPIGIHDWGQAFILEGQEKEEILNSFDL